MTPRRTKVQPYYADLSAEVVPWDASSAWLVCSVVPTLPDSRVSAAVVAFLCGPLAPRARVVEAECRSVPWAPLTLNWCRGFPSALAHFL